MNAVLIHARLDRSISLRAIVALWRLRWRERAELESMTNAELREAGPTPYDARREARKPFWRA